MWHTTTAPWGLSSPLEQFSVRRREAGSLLTGGRPTVDHIGIAVADATAAAAWMTDRLGFPVVHDETLSDPPVRLVYVDAGNVTLQFVEPRGSGRIATFLEEHGEGLHHLCLRVDDVEGAADAIS